MQLPDRESDIKLVSPMVQSFSDPAGQVPGGCIHGLRQSSTGLASSTGGVQVPAAQEVSVQVEVNGVRRAATVPARTLLVHFLRDQLRLTGTHVGCDTTQCGACTVALDGVAVKSCTVLAAQADGHQVTTIEGLAGSDGAAGGALHPVQRAFQEEHALQCGYCTPGMVMAVRQVLADTPDPTEDQIRQALAGNLCRCTGYQNIVAAAVSAAKSLSAGQAGQATQPSQAGQAPGERED
jgi:aerobic carbon-monoxide dehydrogenase small subunit